MTGNDLERNILLRIEYDGRPFHGWQVQPVSPTVQEVLEAALARVTGESVRLGAAGRTDAGVHALGQAASFRTCSLLAPRKFVRALNALTPPSIAILSAREVPPAFDARRSARSKRYRYRLLNRPVPGALEEGRSWHLGFPLDEGAMREAAEHLEGTHDFSSFRASGCASTHAVRTITSACVIREEPFVLLDFEGNGFLRHMVRAVTGTLVEIGRGRIPPAAMAEILLARDRTRAGPTAPPHGLYLVSVDYPPETL